MLRQDRLREALLGPLRTLPHRQPIDRTGRTVEVLASHVQIDHGRHKAGVPQQLADGQHVDSRLQHARGKTVTHRVRRGRLANARLGDPQLASLLNRG